MTIRILLADDHKIMCDGLRNLLESQSGIEVIAVAENRRDAVKLARELKPDVVIMDVSMPNLNGIEATRQIIAESNTIRVIALSMHSDKRFVVDMLKAGAAGYLLKESAFKELVIAVRAVVNHKTYLSSRIAEIATHDYVHHLSKCFSQVSSSITAREREVLQLLAEGKNTKEIASCLYVSVKTVEVHRKNIMDKLNIRNIAGLIKYAIREGLTSLET